MSPCLTATLPACAWKSRPCVSVTRSWSHSFEGFCIIEFFDGPHGPLSDYVHVIANAAYAKHAGIPNVAGQKLREMVPDKADGWVARRAGTATPQ